MTTSPTFDPNRFAGRSVAAAWSRLLKWARPEDDETHDTHDQEDPRTPGRHPHQ